ncbi:MAG: sugar ABC transporter permease [Chloroflexi bacterium]|nr:sugar ABC transporter permease [Chloroflexota bacterium]
MKKRTLRYDKTFGLLLISPWLVGFLLFKLLPIAASLGLSLTDFNMLDPGRTSFVGLANYMRLFQDEAVGYLIVMTLSQAIGIVPLQLVASIFLAALLSSPRLKAPTPVRTLFFLPSIIPGVAIAFMWYGFMDPTTGWLTRFILPAVGLAGFNDVYSDAATAFCGPLARCGRLGRACSLCWRRCKASPAKFRKRPEWMARDHWCAFSALPCR